MKKQNTQVLFSLIFAFSIIVIVITPSIRAYPPDGDCKDYHKVINIIPYYEKDATINLDGLPSEDFWTVHTNNNENGSLIIPMASETYGPSFAVVYLNITFVITDDYLYILCKWFDNSTKPDLGASVYDGLYFCWNIDVPNFSAYFTSGMSTLDMGGGDIDSWDWSCLSSSPPNGTSYFCRDSCFGTNGWYNPSLETEDIEIGYTFRTNISYTLEIRRKLITNDPYDVQFDKSKSYKFNMGIMNDGNHEDHLISWTHALDIRLPRLSPIIHAYNLIVIVSFSALFLLFIRRKIKYNIKIR
ncbi:MAG: hypothetical protein ACFE8B_14205 [Candidatus Hermodarchaeota archaeon]